MGEIVDPFEDTDYDEEKEAKIRAVMAPLVVESPLNPPSRPKPPPRQSDEVVAEEADRIAWETALPTSAREAQFIGNLGTRLLKGITNAEIKKISVKDRVNSYAALHTVRQLLLEKPTANYSFEERQTVQGILDKAKAEWDRRERERQTIDVTANKDEAE